MTASSNTCWEAIASYAEWAARDFDRDGHDRLVGIFERQEWRVSDDGNLRRDTRRTVFGLRLGEVLRSANPTGYGAAIAAIHVDPVFSPWLGGMVGDALGSGTFTAEGVVDSCVASQLTQDGEFIADASKVRERYDQLVTQCTQNTVQHTLLIPMPGLRVDTPAGVWNVGPNIPFGPFSDREFEHCANLGVIESPFSDMGVIEAEYRQGCRVVIDVPAHRSGPGDPGLAIPPSDRSSLKFGDRPWWAMDHVVEDVLTALRLASPKRLVVPGAVLRSVGIGATSAQWYRRLTAPFIQTEVVLDVEVQQRILELWDALSNPVGREVPKICLRRFNSASDRFNIEDSLVDQMVAAEALFLSDLSERTELGYRLRLRAARLLERSGEDVKDTMAFFARAYALRSKVVHGETPGRKDLIIKGNAVDLSQMLEELTRLMRLALVEVVKECASNPTVGTQDYWDSLVLGV